MGSQQYPRSIARWHKLMNLLLGTRPRSSITFALITFSFLGLFLSRLYFSRYPNRATFIFNAIENLECNDSNTTHATEIPNIVHYVWLLRDPRVFRLEFKVFVSVYSSHLYLKPDTIYIHTDSSPEVYKEAKQSGDAWTRRILGLPNVVYNQVNPLSSTNKGIAIKHLEHKADFLRIEALQRFGGLYLDTDAVPLRDITPLRQSGFANILGQNAALKMKHTGYINNGVMMSIPNSNFMDIWHQASHEFFDGRWETASIALLTDLGNRLAAIPHEVLILQPNAFAPMSWELGDQKRLFTPHSDVRAAGGRLHIGNRDPKEEDSCRDKIRWLQEEERPGKADWEVEFTSTYVLHAFDDHIKKIWGWDHQINLEYVLARQSNYAREVYPAIRHAIAAGIIES